MEKQNVIANKKCKVFKINQKSIKILTLTIYIFAMIVFEIGYCNASNVINLLNKNFEEVNYHFSLCRITIYIIFTIIVFFNMEKFIKEALKVYENRYKRVLISIYLVVAIITIIAAMIVIIKNPLLSRGISIGIISVLMGAIFLIYISNNIFKNIIITTFSIGLVFTITTNFNHAIDEKKHFMTSFNIAFGNFDYANNPITDQQIEALPQLSKYTTIDPFLEEKYVANITDEVNMEDVPSTPADYSFIAYLFPAIGIWIAKTIGGSIIDLYIMGRIFNLLLYTILMCLAVKLLPYKKNIFAVVCLMPIALVLAASYSIDGFCIGSVAVLIAYCLKLKKEKETIGIKEIFLLLGLFLLTLFAKSMAYILVAVIFLMLPIKETLKKNKKYIPIILIIAIISVILLLFVVLKVKETHITQDTRAGNDINVSEQLNHVIHDPIFDVRLALNHIKNTFLSLNWYTMLHDDKFFTNTAQCVLIPILLFILYVSVTEDDYHFKIKDKVILILSFLLVYGMTSMVLYLSFTKVGSLSVSGYQTRYILPILPLALFCLSNKNIEVKNKENRNLNVAMVSGFFIMVSIIQAILV